jgi:hypothetical protein
MIKPNDNVNVTFGGEPILTDHRPPHERTPYTATATLKVTHIDPAFEQIARDACADAARQLAEHIERGVEWLAAGIPLGRLAVTSYPNGEVVRRVWDGQREVGRVIVDWGDGFAVKVRAERTGE